MLLIDWIDVKFQISFPSHFLIHSKRNILSKKLMQNCDYYEVHFYTKLKPNQKQHFVIYLNNKKKDEISEQTYNSS